MNNDKIDQLRFDIVLDSTQFNKELKRVEERAKKFNVSVSELLEIERKIDKARAASNTQQAKALRDAERLRVLQQKTATEAEKTALAHQKVRTEAAKTAKEIARAAAAQKGVSASAARQSLLLRDLGTAAGAFLGVRGIEAFLRNLVEVTGQFETQRIALRTMLQDTAGVDELIDKIRELALVSPFTFSDLASYAKQLAAYGIPLNEIYDTTKRLADVSAGLGVDMSRIILAYGQIRAAGVLRGQELRQLTEAGVPILDELARKLTETTGKVVSLGDVFDLVSKKAVSFEMVRDVFTDLTNEGGKFYNMQEELSRSLTGRISNLKDSFEDMLRTLGEDNADRLKGAVDAARNLVEHYQQIGKVLVGLVTTYGAYKAALMAVAAWQKMQGLAESVRLIVMLRKELGLLTATQQAFNITSKANIYIAIASAVLGLVAAFASFNKKHQEAVRASGEAAKNYENERRQLEGLFAAAKKESASKEDRRKAIERINNEYGQYLDGMVSEKASVEELAGAYDKLVQSMRGKYLEEQRQSMTGEQRGAAGKAEAALWGLIQKAVSGSGLDAKTRGDIMGKIQSRLGRYSGGWNANDIYNEVVNTIRNAGGKAPGNRASGSLYSAAWDFKEAQSELRRAEDQFRAFSDGFAQAVNKAADSATAGAEKIVYKTTAIAEGIEILQGKVETLEKKASGVGITEEERKTLAALREDLEDQKNEYKSITGKEYGKGAAAAIRKAAGEESAERTFYEGLRRDIEKYENEITQAQIDAMDEGAEKTLARLDLEHRQREQAIIANYNTELEKLRATAEKEGRKFDPENDAQAKALRSATETALTAEAMTWGTAVSNVEKKMNEQREQNRLEYLAKYGEMEQRRAAITEKYEKQIQKARAESDEYLAKSLEKQRDAELYGLEREYSALYALIFAEAEDLTNTQLAKAIEITQGEISKAAESGDIERLTELYSRLRSQMETQATREDWGFPGLIKGYRMMVEESDLYDTYIAIGDKEAAANALAKRQNGISMMKKAAGEISDAFQDLGKTLEKFGGKLGEIGGFLSGVASNTDNIVTAFTSQDKGSVIASGIASAVKLIDMVGTQIQENKEKQEEWNQTVRQCAHEYAMLVLHRDDYEQSNTFGVESPYQKAIDGMRRYAAALEMLRIKEDELAAGMVQTGTEKGVSWKNIGTGIAAGAGVGAAIGTAVGGWAAGLGTIIGTAIGAVVGGLTGLFGGMKEVPVFENLLSKYGDILDRSNEEHPFALNPQILADYDKLDDATKQIVDNWEDIQEAAEDALEEVHETITELVGDIGDTLRESLVNAWTDGQIYRAVDEFHDYIGGVIEDITEQLIFAKFLQPAFDELAAAMDASFLPEGDQDIRDDLAEFAAALPGYIDGFATAMDQARAALAEYGFNAWANLGTAGESLGGGISQITENTANLLASYLNAMRADVSDIRSRNATGWETVSGIYSYVPTLAEYLNQVEANTRIIADNTHVLLQNTQRMLSEIQSVIAPPGASTSMVVHVEQE